MLALSIMEKKTKTDKNKALKARFLEYFAELPVQKLAAAYIGKDETTIINWKNADSNFSNQIDLAKAEWARKKVKGVRSNEWVLERILKDHFAPRQEVTGADGESLQIEIIEEVKK